jgi:DNA-directed RNA polymerase subunit beta'
MLKTTIGQLMLNRALPEDMRDHGRVLDKKGTRALLAEVQERYPEKYREISKELMDIGRDAAYSTGGLSFGLEHLAPGPVVKASRQRLTRRIREIQASNWSDDRKEEKIVEATAIEQDRLQVGILEEGLANDNPLAASVLSGSRGSPSNLKRLISGDSLYVDHRNQVIPVPIQRSYSEGLTPGEWFAASFGARRGLIDGKFATQDAGFFSKQLNQLAHRLMVTDVDDDGEPDVPRGLPVSTEDTDNEGALLAIETGGHPRNTVLTPKILQELRQKGIKRMLVRSPAVGGPAGGGVYARDVGVRERGGMSPLGDEVGLAAAQALSEKLTQGQLKSKHGGGVRGATRAATGFEAINQLVQYPKRFKGGAAHAQADGLVGEISPAPAGGWKVMVGGEEHFIAPGFEPKVKRGDSVEAGDVLSDGMPNPAQIVAHKGIGEGRRYFTEAFIQSYRDSGMPANRRNVELIARGLIDHVEMLDEDEDSVPGDVVSYSDMERRYRPRQGYRTVAPKQAVGRYLERPVLHHTIGTKIRPSMVADFNEFGVTNIDVHDDPPPFQPRAIRAMENARHDKDWLTRFIGSNQKKSILSAAHRGGVSDTAGTSFVPALAEGVSFGSQWPKNVLRNS